MSTLAIAHLRNVVMGPAIRQYLKRIDATLTPHGGRFLVHGGPPDVLEGRWSDDVIIIEFPSRAHARRWYASSAYRAILPLRAAHADGDVFLVDTVPEAHRATDVLPDGPPPGER